MLNFGIKDIIDIVSVALLLFYIYRLMKASRSANVFSGILIFIVAWIFVTRIFEMRLLGGIMNQLMSIGSIALIVIFQEEIRHFFSTIGTNRSASLLWRFFRTRHTKGTPKHSEYVLPIVMACISMSKQKVGALIVLERNVSLTEEASTGDEIYAKINQRLIENIFFKNSPLHDGAMIISHKRIRAAGCILPVSHDPTIPKNYGLRHRAAIGIAEKSDCLSIVVSEETGSISVVENGVFRPRLGTEELERILMEQWV